MEDSIFNEYVKHLVENKALVPRYHAMLTAKLSDYDLRLGDWERSLLRLGMMVLDDLNLDIFAQIQ